MEEKELNKVLRDKAREHGLCDQWFNEWDLNSDKKVLIQKYIKGIDFCIKHDYPSTLFIKEYFDDTFCKQNGIYVDSVEESINPDVAVILGKSNVHLAFRGLVSRNVYVCHQSKVFVEVEDGAKVFIECHGDAEVSVSADDFSKAFVYRYGGYVKTEGNVLVREGEKKNPSK